MKKPFIAGNWKMYTTVSEAINLSQAVKAGANKFRDAQIVLCPPFTSLQSVSKVIEDSSIELGAQNMHPSAEGAFTGEISPAMIKDVRCRYVILGHSERRQYFKETNAFINEKVKAALKYSLMPILCVGETLAEREARQHLDVVKIQVDQSLKDLTKEDMLKIVIAYEPVWAIGTGKTASPEEAEQMHAYIRRLLKERFTDEIAPKVPILYGGSVKPDNIESLILKPNVDGALVGGASLKADSFTQIIQNACQALEVGAKK